jgi:hypothetical protein
MINLDFLALYCFVYHEPVYSLVKNGVIDTDQYNYVLGRIRDLSRKSYTKKTPPSKGRALGPSEAATEYVQLILDL